MEKKEYAKAGCYHEKLTGVHFWYTWMLINENGYIGCLVRH